MKASKLIEELQKLISEHGDLDVLVPEEQYGPLAIEYIKYDENPHYTGEEPPAFVIRSV